MSGVVPSNKMVLQSSLTRSIGVDKVLWLCTLFEFREFLSQDDLIHVGVVLNEKLPMNICVEKGFWNKLVETFENVVMEFNTQRKEARKKKISVSQQQLVELVTNVWAVGTGIRPGALVDNNFPQLECRDLAAVIGKVVQELDLHDVIDCSVVDIDQGTCMLLLNTFSTKTRKRLAECYFVDVSTGLEQPKLLRDSAHVQNLLTQVRTALRDKWTAEVEQGFVELSIDIVRSYGQLTLLAGWFIGYPVVYCFGCDGAGSSDSNCLGGKRLQLCAVKIDPCVKAGGNTVVAFSAPISLLESMSAKLVVKQALARQCFAWNHFAPSDAPRAYVETYEFSKHRLAL